MVGSSAEVLTSKGVGFGTLTITHTGGATTCTESLAPPAGDTTNAVSADLVVRPFQWKGSAAFLRDFVRSALHNAIRMQASQLLCEPTVAPAPIPPDRDGT